MELAVRRPAEAAGAFRNIGERARFAAIHGEQIDLRRLRLAVFVLLLGRAQESERAAVRRPARTGIVRAGGQLARGRRPREGMIHSDVS